MSKPVILSTSPESLAREHLTEAVQPWEEGLRADTRRGSFEWWYFDAHFDDPSKEPDPSTPFVPRSPAARRCETAGSGREIRVRAYARTLIFGLIPAIISCSIDYR